MSVILLLNTLIRSTMRTVRNSRTYSTLQDTGTAGMNIQYSGPVLARRRVATSVLSGSERGRRPLPNHQTWLVVTGACTRDATPARNVLPPHTSSYTAGVLVSGPTSPTGLSRQGAHPRSATPQLSAYKRKCTIHNNTMSHQKHSTQQHNVT